MTNEPLPYHNEKELYKVLKQLKNIKDHHEYVTDKSGVKIVELIAPRLELDPDQPIICLNG